MYVTPCISVCKIDEDTNLCLGCNRTKEEIRNWPNMTSEERLVVMRRLGYGQRIGRVERLRRYARG